MNIEYKALPADLKDEIGLEKIDFCIKTDKSTELKSLRFLVFLIVLSLLFTLYFNIKSIFKFVGIDIFHPLLVSPTEVNPNALIDVFYYIISRIIPLGTFISIIWFVLIKIKKEKGIRFWVATENRLILYKIGVEQVYYWKDFNGNIEFELNKKALTLELRRGLMPYKSKIDADAVNNESINYSPEKIQIIDVDNVLEIVSICQSRIKQHDPTPST